MRLTLPGVLLVAGTILATPTAAQGWPGRDRLEPESCSATAPGTPDPATWLRRAAASIGLPNAAGKVITWSGSDTDVQFYQSDRPYPPFLASVTSRTWYFAPETGVERAQSSRGGAILSTDGATFMARDTLVRPAEQAHAFFAPYRDLNPYAVLADFGHADLGLDGRCTFRGFPRVVLRSSAGERLYLDEKSGTPVKLERMEAHPTWGQVRAEYVYTTWWRGEGVSIPIAAVRYIDGVEHLRRDVALPQRRGEQVVHLVAGDSAPRLAVPAADQRGAVSPFNAQTPVDTVRIDQATWLLTTPSYTHAVTLQRDTVFLFDATMADWRSRADSTWIATLFGPGHPMVLVVTDLAWPHVGGVRFWLARGARLVTHRQSIPFLTQLVERRWTLTPDVLEGARRARGPNIRGIDRPTVFAGGAIRLGPIDGVASEGALYASLPGSGFLWAGDYLQSVDGPSQYGIEIVAAVARDGIATPSRVAAQHLELTEWDAVLRANPVR